MTERPSIAAALCGVVALLAGCGGGDDDAPAAATPTTTTAAVTAESVPTLGVAEPEIVRVTPLGTTLKLGEPAVIDYEDASNHKASLIRLTPGPVERGTLDDFKNIELDADQKAATPFYVKVKVTNVGPGDLSDTSPATYLSGIDDRGQSQNEVIFLGTFDRCPSHRAEKLKAHASYSTCLTYLVPGGGAIVGLRWIAFDERTGKSNLEWR